MPAGEKQVNCLHLHSAIMGAAWLAGHSVPRGQPCMRHYRRSRRACSREWVSRAVAATGALFDGFLTKTAPVLLLLRWQIVVAVHNTKWTIKTQQPCLGMPGWTRFAVLCASMQIGDHCSLGQSCFRFQSCTRAITWLIDGRAAHLLGSRMAEGCAGWYAAAAGGHPGAGARGSRPKAAAPAEARAPPAPARCRLPSTGALRPDVALELGALELGAPGCRSTPARAPPPPVGLVFRIFLHN